MIGGLPEGKFNSGIKPLGYSCQRSPVARHAGLYFTWLCVDSLSSQSIPTSAFRPACCPSSGQTTRWLEVYLTRSLDRTNKYHLMVSVIDDENQARL